MDLRIRNLLEIPLSWFRTFFYRGVHIDARALHVLNLIWFGNIARLSQCEEGGNFLFQMILPVFATRREVGTMWIGLKTDDCKESVDLFRYIPLTDVSLFEQLFIATNIILCFVASLLSTCWRSTLVYCIIKFWALKLYYKMCSL